jgi:hypothetical protein
MDEYVASAIACDKPVTFGVVEPLDSAVFTLCHDFTSLSLEFSWSRAFHTTFGKDGDLGIERLLTTIGILHGFR